MGMRKTMIALLAASASISALANTNGSDIWQQYTPLMVTEIYAMTASSDEVVSVLQAEGDFLLSNLGVAHNPRLQSMSQAILAMEERGISVNEAAAHMRFTVSIGANLFLEIAKIRALRELWAIIVKECGGSEEAAKIKLRIF